MSPPRSFQEFWPYYLGEHRQPPRDEAQATDARAQVEPVEIASSVKCGVERGGAEAAAVDGARGSEALLVRVAPDREDGGLLVGYGPAWVGHFFVENNKPASFKYPLWSFMADIKMLALKLGGQMDGEMTRLYGSSHPAPDAPLRRGGPTS